MGLLNHGFWRLVLVAMIATVAASCATFHKHSPVEAANDAVASSQYPLDELVLAESDAFGLRNPFDSPPEDGKCLTGFPSTMGWSRTDVAQVGGCPHGYSFHKTEYPLRGEGSPTTWCVTESKEASSIIQEYGVIKTTPTEVRLVLSGNAVRGDTRAEISEWRVWAKWPDEFRVVGEADGVVVEIAFSDPRGGVEGKTLSSATCSAPTGSCVVKGVGKKPL